MLRFGRAVLFAAMLAVFFDTAGCPLGCGVGPVDDGAHVKDGVVTFDNMEVGEAEPLVINFDDTVGAAETIQGATITGPDASSFQIESTFPIDLSEGAMVQLTISFTPKAAGPLSATLTLQTMNMGPSPVTLTGTGVD